MSRFAAGDATGRGRPQRWSWRPELGAALVAAGVSLLVGLVLAVVWLQVAPRPTYRVVDAGVALDGLTNGAYVAADGWLGVLGVLAGVLCAGLLYRRLRARPVGLVVGLVVGGLLGAVVAWRTGQAVAPDDVLALAQGHDVGSSFPGGLDLRARGVLLGWPLAAAVTAFVLVATLERPLTRSGGRRRRAPE